MDKNKNKSEVEGGGKKPKKEGIKNIVEEALNSKIDELVDEMYRKISPKINELVENNREKTALEIKNLNWRNSCIGRYLGTILIVFLIIISFGGVIGTFLTTYYLPERDRRLETKINGLKDIITNDNFLIKIRIKAAEDLLEIFNKKEIYNAELHNAIIKIMFSGKTDTELKAKLEPLFKKIDPENYNTYQKEFLPTEEPLIVSGWIYIGNYNNKSKRWFPQKILRNYATIFGNLNPPIPPDELITTKQKLELIGLSNLRKNPFGSGKDTSVIKTLKEGTIVQVITTQEMEHPNPYYRRIWAQINITKNQQ